MLTRLKPAAVLGLLPFVVIACDVNESVIANSAENLSGCDTQSVFSCNAKYMQGVVAKLKYDDTTQSVQIRFIKLENGADDTVTYSDGEDVIVFTPDGLPFYTGDDGETAYAEILQLASGFFDGESIEGSQTEAGFGVFGFQTDESVIPTEGNAYYAGGAEFLTRNQGAIGASDLYVDFAAGTADLETFVLAGSITSFDKVTAENMRIEGNTFTGSNVSLSLAGDSVSAASVVGNDPVDGAAGMFFGPLDDDGNPVEYGAVAIVSGGDDIVLVRALGSTSP